MGIVELPVSEIERRKNHIDLIDPTQALLPIAKNCIQFQDKDRPSSEELCHFSSSPSNHQHIVAGEVSVNDVIGVEVGDC